MELVPGTMLQNRYRIVNPLGQGGMGAVYRAWDTRLSIAVALKEMIPQPGLDSATLSELQEQFQQEAVVLARLNHPHLVRVTDFFQEKQKAYLAMDFVEGESLAEKIEREGAQTETQVVRWTEQLLDALAYCHAEGIIHRDIKPQNVICRLDGNVKLVDFGLVKLWNPQDPQTRTVMRGMGTPEYAPPEQYDIHGSHTDARSDIYSLGATLYHALTGQIPPTATLRMAKPEAFKPPRTFKRDLSPGLEQVVTRAMALPVQERFGSAEEMGKVLRGGGWAPTVSAAPEGLTPPPPPLQRTVRMPESEPLGPPPPPHASSAWSGRTPPPPSRKRKGLPLWGWVAGAGGLLLIVALICGGLLLGGVLDNNDPTPRPTSTSTSVAPPSPTNTPTQSRDVVPATGNDVITVNNQSSQTICYVQISPSTADQWGEDWLDPAEVISTNTSRSFEVAPDQYDVNLMDCNRVTLHTEWEVEGNTEIVVGGSNTVQLYLKNQSTSNLCFVYISSVTATEWGEDWLGAKEVVRATTGERIFFVPSGDYDLLARDCDGNTLAEERDVAVYEELTWTLTD